MILMTEIDKGLYVHTNEIKFIVDMTRRSASSKNIRKNAAMNNKLFYNCSKNISKAFVVLEDDTVFYSSFNSSTIAKKAEEHGKKLLSVDSEIFISVQHIKAVSDKISSRLVEDNNNSETTGSELQFLRKGERKQTELIMKSGEKVRLSKLAKICIDEINS